MSIPRIIIIGGGFAGVKCAQTLRRHLPENKAEVVLFDQNNHMVFSPLLAEVAGASINPDAVAVPLRQMLPTVHCRTERIQAIHPDANRVDFQSLQGGIESLSYDHVMLAPGSTVDMGFVPGMANHAFPLKTIGDGMLLRSHVLQQLEAAEVAPNAEKRRWHLSFLIVGGGFSGVEVAGEINDLTRGARKHFRNIAKDDITVQIIHGHDTVLPEVSVPLRHFAKRQMEKAGITFIIPARAKEIRSDGVLLQDGRFISGATTVATVGNAVSPLLKALSLTKSKRGLLLTQPDLRVVGTTNVWAIGDCSDNINAYDNQPAPWTGQFAEREGRQAAENLVRLLKGEPTRPFTYRPMGQLCSIGGHRAVADVMGFRLAGFLAWVLWRGVYLFKMPSWSRRIRVGLDWLWDLFFARDLVYVRPDVTARLVSSTYNPGDTIFNEGAPPSGFYVIEQGEVEILRDGHVVTVLKAGEFFGELAVMQNRPHSATARAKSEARLMIFPTEMFKQMSEAWTPLRQLLSENIRKYQTPPVETTIP